MSDNDAVILGGARTPFGSFGGSLKDLGTLELGVAAARGALERSRVDPARVDHVIFGNVIQGSGDVAYLARHIGLKAGCPIDTPALTVNRLCGSGLQAIVSAAQLVRLGEASVVLAGGAESMSGQPHVIRGARWGLRFRAGSLEDNLWLALVDPYNGLPMAATAENLARKYAISRKEQDDYAHRSHQAAASVRARAAFAEEIVPVPVGSRGRTTLVSQDEHVKPDTTIDKLNALPAALAEDGTVSAGNASGINDGAVAVIVTTERLARRGWR